MNIEQIRLDTRHCDHKLFINSAGSSLPPACVTDAMVDYLYRDETIGGYANAARSLDEINAFYTEAALLLNTKAENIAFAYNATDAYARALSSIPMTEGDYVLTTDDDYISNQIAFLSLQKRFGIRLIRAHNLSNGDLNLDHFEELIKQYHPKLVAVTHIPTNSGLVQDAIGVGRLCRQYDCWYLLDACQSVGQMVVDVQEIGCDFLSATGRKFLRGPRASGLLYVSDKALTAGLEPLYIDMIGAHWTGTNTYTSLATAKKFELWETQSSALIGLKEAIRYANQIGISKIQKRNELLSKHLRDILTPLPGLHVLDRGSRQSSIITVGFDHKSLESVQNVLNAHQVFYSVARKESAFIDFTKKGYDWAIRLSPHYFNTVEELDQVAGLICV